MKAVAVRAGQERQKGPEKFHDIAILSNATNAMRNTSSATSEG